MAPERISDAVETWVQLQARDLIWELAEVESGQHARCTVELQDSPEAPRWCYRLHVGGPPTIFRVRCYQRESNISPMFGGGEQPYPTGDGLYHFTREYLVGSLLDPEALKAALRLAYLKGRAEAISTEPSFEDLTKQVETVNAARK